MLLRLFSIARILARHNALLPLQLSYKTRPVAALARLCGKKDASTRLGKNLAASFEELGPTFIKLGQALSTRPDLVGEEIADDLAGLRDRVQPFDTAIAKAVIEKDFKKPVDALFSSFDDMPVAAASVAQVHLATTMDGDEVAVKILRPNLRKIFARDLALLYWLADVVTHARPALQRLRLRESVQTFEKTLLLETDLRFEAAAASEMAENFAGDPTFHVPEIDWIRTSRHVMTAEKIDGIPLHKRDALIAAGHDPVQLTENASRIFFNMVFHHGFFHGDMHPGNLFVDEKGAIVAVDFGITGRIEDELQVYLGEILLGFLSGDYKKVAKAHFKAGFVKGDLSAFAGACRSVGQPILDRPMHEISVGKLLSRLFEVTADFGMKTQPKLLLLQKTMLTAEGIGRRLAPEVNMWETARPLMTDWAMERLSPEASLRHTARTATETITALPHLITRAERAVSSFTSDGLKIHPDTIEELLNRSIKKGRRRRRRIPMAMLVPWFIVFVLLWIYLWGLFNPTL